MLDKKINQTIDALIKKIKDNNLGSIKLSNKINTIEITNNLINENANQKTQKNYLNENQNIKNETDSNFVSIDSPMVGVIYLTPKPSSPPFAKKGQKIKKGDTICLIEAMKTFNEIKAPRSGIIKKIVTLNSQPVEYGDTLIIFE